MGAKIKKEKKEAGVGIRTQRGGHSKNNQRRSREEEKLREEEGVEEVAKEGQAARESGEKEWKG